MAFQWTKYLDLAKELAKPDPSALSQEARYRSAVSRAYYAAFHKAGEYLVGLEGPFPFGENKHEYVIKKFLDKTHPNHRVRERIGIDLDRLRVDRNICDYEDDYRGGLNALQKKAAESVAVADRILVNLSKL